jgi:hypothetical protein
MARAFGSPGSLTTETPSLLTRRDAVSRLATENRAERNLYKRAFRQLGQLSRRGNAQASLAALDLYDRAQENNVQLTGIPNAGQEFNSAAMQLRDDQQFNADVQGIVTPNERAVPMPNLSNERAVPMPNLSNERAVPMPNETLATTNLPDEPATMGTGTGIDATRNISGPSAAQGGPLSSRPVWSSRNASGGPLQSPIGAADMEALNALATPEGPGDPTMPFYNQGGTPSRALVIPEQYGGGIGLGETLDQQFRRRYPNFSRLLDQMSPANPATASRPSTREVERAGKQMPSILDRLRKGRMPGLDGPSLAREEQISRIV